MKLSIVAHDCQTQYPYLPHTLIFKLNVGRSDVGSAWAGPSWAWPGPDIDSNCTKQYQQTGPGQVGPRLHSEFEIFK